MNEVIKSILTDIYLGFTCLAMIAAIIGVWWLIIYCCIIYPIIGAPLLAVFISWSVGQAVK